MAHLHVSKPALGALICSAATALSLSSAAADPPGAETFEGACQMSGVIRHQPPLTQDPASTKFHGRFSGGCSGLLTDRHGRTRQLDAAPARYDGRGAGQLSCLGGISYGTGKLTFGHGETIEFRLTERRTPGVAVVTLEGEGGGTATVLGTVSPEEDLAELNERCSGPGIRFLRGDARITSPGISG